MKIQEISNILFQKDGRISIKGSNSGLTNQIFLVRATGSELSEVNNILSNFNGISNENVAITLANGSAITKESLVQTILANDNIYIPFKRTIQFSKTKMYRNS